MWKRLHAREHIAVWYTAHMMRELIINLACMCCRQNIPTGYRQTPLIHIFVMFTPEIFLSWLGSTYILLNFNLTSEKTLDAYICTACY